MNEHNDGNGISNMYNIVGSGKWMVHTGRFAILQGERK
jgi:hypothetical protein